MSKLHYEAAMRPTPTPAPSGRQIEISSGVQRATIVELGGALRSYTVGARDRIEGYDRDEICSGSRGQALVPWPNRIAGGSYEFGGTHHQLALNEPTLGNAIHGLVRWSGFTVGEHAADRVTMHHTLFPQPGYPFMLGIEIEYALDDSGLCVRTTATNLGGDACPYGTGFHPYLRLDPTRIDGLELSSPAATYYVSDDCKIPIERADVAGSPFDFREPRLIGATQMDHAFTALERGTDGRATVRLRDPATGDAAELWLEAPYEYLMLFTGDALPDPHRRRTGLAVEPMTCAPNAFQSGDGLQVIEAGSSVSATWGLTITQAAR